MRQFNLANIRQSADGKIYTAVVVDRDCNRFTEFPRDVKVLCETDDGLLVQFPANKLVHGSVLDFDR